MESRKKRPGGQLAGRDGMKPCNDRLVRQSADGDWMRSRLGKQLADRDGAESEKLKSSGHGR